MVTISEQFKTLEVQFRGLDEKLVTAPLKFDELVYRYREKTLTFTNIKSYLTECKNEYEQIHKSMQSFLRTSTTVFRVCKDEQTKTFFSGLSSIENDVANLVNIIRNITEKNFIESVSKINGIILEIRNKIPTIINTQILSQDASLPAQIAYNPLRVLVKSGLIMAFVFSSIFMPISLVAQLNFAPMQPITAKVTAESLPVYELKGKVYVATSAIPRGASITVLEIRTTSDGKGYALVEYNNQKILIFAYQTNNGKKEWNIAQVASQPVTQPVASSNLGFIATESINIRDKPAGKIVDGMTKGQAVRFVSPAKEIKGQTWRAIQNGFGIAWICIKDGKKELVQSNPVDKPDSKAQQFILKHSAYDFDVIELCNIEKFRARKYPDPSEPSYSIGYGTHLGEDYIKNMCAFFGIEPTLLETGSITENLARAMVYYYIVEIAVPELQKEIPFFQSLHPKIRSTLIHIHYNVGSPRLNSEYKEILKAIRLNDPTALANAIKTSDLCGPKSPKRTRFMNIVNYLLV